jgi:CRISPR-associated endoribonuclease Cas6
MKRIELTLSHPEKVVPYNYQPKISAKIKEWANPHNSEGGNAAFSYSWLEGEYKSFRNLGGLFYSMGANMVISAYQDTLIEQLSKSISKKKMFLFGMKIRSHKVVDVPVFTKREYRFKVTSPVLIKKQVGDESRYLTYKDKEANDRLTHIMQNKIKAAGLSGDIRVEFNLKSPVKKLKLIDINGIKYSCSICGVVIKGDPELIRFAYTVGIGQRTGMGFGFLSV